MSEQLFLSLGTNLGDRDANLANAITALGLVDGISGLITASIYESDPLEIKNQPKFLNTVISVQSNLNPFDILDETQRIEAMLGRPRNHIKHYPRTIDIDIICYGTTRIATERLTIPHPKMAERKFVLIPFAEIAPDFIIPGYNKSVQYLLIHCPDRSHVTKQIYKGQA
ncbi:MAG: 2-amino-4-hydroxy-6-hydroxymethyldihydropteridine diphosphokinase [Fidelibacterota bacterium]